MLPVGHAASGLAEGISPTAYIATRLVLFVRQPAGGALVPVEHLQQPLSSLLL